MRISVPIIAAVVLATVSASAVRADFTIDVSVDFKNLAPEVNSIEVACSVCNNNSTKCDAKSGMVASGTASHPFAAGTPRTFKGTITVVAKSLKSPQFDNTATDYVCLWGINAGGLTADPSPNANDPWLRPQPGTPFTQSVSGKVPHSAPGANPSGAGGPIKAQ